MSDGKKCKFDIAWCGQCPAPAVADSLFCGIHIDKKCVSCGKQATHECPETHQFVCGAPLCDDCHHISMMNHAPKS